MRDPFPVLPPPPPAAITWLRRIIGQAQARSMMNFADLASAPCDHRRVLQDLRY